MSLNPNDVIWVFDGRRGLSQMLGELVDGLCETIAPVLPPSVTAEHADAFEALAADDGFDATKHIDNIRLSRLFPRPVTPEHDADSHGWDSMIRNRATTMFEQAKQVRASIDAAGAIVPVRQREVHAWLQTLGALRASWHAVLTRSDAPNAEPTRDQLLGQRPVAAMLDWLAYMIEDLLDTREACEMAGTGLDVEGIEEWTDD